MSHHVMSRRVVSRCIAAPCRIMSGHVASCHLCHVMSCHITSRHVTSRHVMSCHVTSCHVVSRHVMPCHVVSCRVMSCPVLSRCVVSSGEKRPQHIDTATSLSQYANARCSHSQCSLSYHSRSHSLHSHHSHACARVVLSTSHRFRFRLPTHVFSLSFRCGVIRFFFLLGLSRKRSCATIARAIDFELGLLRAHRAAEMKLGPLILAACVSIVSHGLVGRFGSREGFWHCV